jgi:hypothetical protein
VHDIGNRLDLAFLYLVGNPPREFTQQVRAEHEKWRGLVKKTDLKLE